MARFSVEGDDDGNGEGPSNNKPLPNKRPRFSFRVVETRERPSAGITLSTSADPQIACSHDSEQESEEQEEEDEEEESEEREEEEEEDYEEYTVQPTESNVDSARNRNGTDCVDAQCESGHIACASCCTKMKNKCASCSLPIGYNRCRAIERVLDSVRLSCSNMEYGCREKLQYSKKLQHEKTCNYAPCSCPYPDCMFSGLTRSIYNHFSLRHGGSRRQFVFNTACKISLVADRSKHVFLQEKTHYTLFVLNHCVRDLGSLVSVDCIAQASSDTKFVYDICASDGESTIKLTSVAENTGRWIKRPLEKKYVLVPKDFRSSSGMLVLECTIWRASQPI
ncbi:E3 ubiquitin-protein ligase SINA-like 10 [Striga hermonthica]|uniref:RING-type E3 ubiquitin transferase n=1 Tax=Striga hermonthica TaxID=68872 RepID=A0A9N7NG79_STRHE|nr:E3 ubiquitin-protein ligase SINA-like 10 [Striga hermonthica]